jgi:site-specific DNA-methyltransferase (adenine-specific)
MKPTLTIRNAVIYQGNNLEVLPTLPDNSVDSIVCDPPYELGFMGKSWDSSGIAYSVELWRECLRVLKPGGHLLAFGGTRTWHRLAVAIEDAGFEIRDNIAWLYGSGFPKSHNISKAIDKAAGAERTVVGSRIADDIRGGNMHAENRGQRHTIDITASATDDAKAWDGWGTALKPAHEPIVVARKPLIGTVAENVLQHGVGGLNIDATRIGMSAKDEKNSANNWKPQGYESGNNIYEIGTKVIATEQNTIGRWPANIILDEYTATLLPESNATGSGKASGFRKGGGDGNSVGLAGTKNAADGFSDSGSVSRFFYVAKASKQDRNQGLENIEGQEISAKGNGLARTCNSCGASTLDGCDCPDRTFSNPVRQNFHPTVKPTALMQYLIRLVTPAHGVVLDPFAGSGSTGKAAILENKQFIGIEITPEYLPIIAGRLTHAYETLDRKEVDLFE